LRVFDVHPGCSMYQNIIHFYGWIIFHCMVQLVITFFVCLFFAKPSFSDEISSSTEWEWAVCWLSGQQNTTGSRTSAVHASMDPLGCLFHQVLLWTLRKSKSYSASSPFPRNF
jgi:hypothetical protein